MKKRQLFVLVLVASLAFLTVPHEALAGGPPMGRDNVEFLAQMGGRPYAVAVRGTYAYVGVGPNLFILDVANPTIPQTEGHLLLPDMVRGITIVGSYAYIGDRWSGLRIVDVSTPEQPVEVGSWETWGWVHGVAVSGGYAYLATTEGLVVIDVADPTSPVYHGGLATPGYGQRLVVRGGYVYYADGSAGLRIIDVSNPTVPKEVGHCETISAEDVAVAGNYAYVASNKDGNFLKVVDVSNPAQPQQVASSDHLGGWINAVEVSGNYVFLNTHERVRIIDISNPLEPNPVGFYDVPGRSAQDVKVAGNYAYVTCDFDGGLRVVDVSAPDSPIEVGAWGTLGVTGGVAAVDDYAYISRSGLSSIVDVTDPAYPTVVGSMPWSFSDFEAAGSYAFLAASDLLILNIADPVNPLAVSTLDTPRYVECLAKVGGHVYLAEQGWWDGSQYTGGGLRITDVSDPSSPQRVGYLGMSGLVEGIAVTSAHVYMAYREEGLRIINVSDPFNPVQVGSLASQEYAQDVATDGHYIYWGAGSDLHVLDLSDPAHPVQIGAANTRAWVQRVAVMGNYVFVDNNRGLYVIDVSTPTNPTAIAWYGTVGDSTSGLAVAGNLAYIASDQGGVFILRPLRDEVSGTIDAMGGNLSSTDGDINFTLPTGAVTDTVQLVYRHWLFDERTFGDLVGIGRTFNVAAVYSDTGQPAQLAPGQSYTITLRYTDVEKGPAIEDTLGLYWWDGSDWSQEGISSTVNVVNNMVSAQADHFSLFAVLGETQRVYLPLILRNR
ncbi:MAG: LVIVD repeat protein [Chloroflexi bacterium ADurb.Bin360]|nr:MAG: LVIVD repeat protein [Chloroflexi bacterium ADurb.Bin360]HQM14155.1 hypothetical protein [Anaerolineae bacterium]